MDIKFSKSKIKQYIQCPRQLWLQTHNPSLAQFSKESLSKFKNGNKVGDYARLVYPNGNLVTARKNEKKIEETLILLPKKEVIFEAAFVYNNTICQVDVLRPYYENDVFIGWDVIECKAGTSAKEEYIEDIAIQYYIITSSQTIPIHKFYIWHINRDAVDANSLFKEEEIEERLIPYLSKYDPLLDKCKELIQEKTEPVCSIGQHCDNPYECAFKNHCWKHVPLDKKTIFDIPSFTKKWDAFKNGMILLNKESSKELVSKYGVKDYILEAIESNNMYVNKELITNFFENIVFPISSLDFESMQYLIPPFQHVRPYEQVPFQFSLKVLHEDGGLENFGFLNQNESDPRRALLEELIAVLPETGNILAYNMTFEKMILKKLGELYPDLRHKVLNIIARLIDPYPLIEKAIYHPSFGNSYSIKSVAPALLGEQQSYNKLVIQNGQQSQDMYLELIKTNDIMKRIEINQQMRDYCDLDVQNLILIFVKLMELSNLYPNFKIYEK